jgi:hypothetical protein
MAYSFQTFAVNEILTSTKMNQIEVNVRDHVHGVSGVAALPQVTNSLGADVALNNTANYFDGPSCAQGTAGIWEASGTVTVLDTTGAATFAVKLWDGTTVIASAQMNSPGASGDASCSLSGRISSPAGNIRISVKDKSFTTGKIVFNNTSESKDSTLTVTRVG